MTDFNELQKRLNRIMQEHNSGPQADFEDFSPEAMHRLLHDPFGAQSPLSLQTLRAEDYASIPLLRQIRYLAGLIGEAVELKLTKNGFLPVKVVAEVYAQGILTDDYIERGIKLYKETDSVSVQITRLMLELTGITKKRNNKLSLTAKSEKLLKNDKELFETLFIGFTTRFNWAYFDGYSDEQTGQLGCGFSLALLAKYGVSQQTSEFYAAKYFRAFPMLFENFSSEYNPLFMAEGCYSLRTFKHFLYFFGLVEIEYKGRGSDRRTYIRRTSLFDRLIVCKLP